MHAEIEVAHFGEKPLLSVNPVWKITEEDRTVAEGKLEKKTFQLEMQ